MTSEEAPGRPQGKVLEKRGPGRQGLEAKKRAEKKV